MVRVGIVVSLLLLGAASGCMSDVQGTAPTEGCGNLSSHVVGRGVAWAGRTFEAYDDGARLTVDVSQTGRFNDWWGEDADGARAWSVIVLDITQPESVVLGAAAGLVEYEGTTTTVHVGPVAPNVGGTGPGTAGFEALGPFRVGPGQRVLVMGAADVDVSVMGVDLLWQGCGRTGHVRAGPGAGTLVGWSDLQGTASASTASGAAAAFQATYGADWPAGVFLVQPPKPEDEPLWMEASFASSRGEARVQGPVFGVHDGGGVAYSLDYVGGRGSSSGPLAAFWDVPTSLDAWESAPLAADREGFFQ